MLRLPRGNEPLLGEWARVLNSIILRREPLILSTIYDCTKWYVRYLAPYSCMWVQEHLQSTDDGGYLYDPDNYTSSVLIDCRTERMRDFETAMDPMLGYSLFLIPVQYDGEGNKVLYDGESAEDRMVGVTNCCNPPFFKIFMFDAFKVNEITEATTDEGVTIEGTQIEDGVIHADEINEYTTDAGVTIEGVSIENGATLTPNGAYIGNLQDNYAEIKDDGEINLHGTARVWHGVDLDASAVKLPGSNPPAEDEIDGFLFQRFDRGTEESVYYLWTVPHDFAAGDASVRGHFSFVVESPPTTPSGDEAVVMGFEYKKISEGDVVGFSVGTTSGTITETIAADETPWILHITSEGTCVTTGWTVHDKILFRFYRDATNVADTYDNEAVGAANDVWVDSYHLEYLADKLGEAS